LFAHFFRQSGLPVALKVSAAHRACTNPTVMDLLTSAFRQLRAHAAFSTLIVLLLALGIGANTAIFGVVHAVLLKPLPYPEPGDLVLVRKLPREGAATQQLPGGGDMMPDNELLAWLDAVPKSFRSLAGYRNNAATLQRGDGAVRVPAASVTGEFFPMLGVSAWRGRLFGADDLKPGAAPVTVLSHAAWQARFNGEDSALGQVVKLDDVAHTVIGVLPPSFEFTDPVQFWRPLPLVPNAPGQLRIQMIRVLGRLLPGTSREIAQTELDGISERFWGNFGPPRQLSPGGPAGPQGSPVAQRVVAGPTGAQPNQPAAGPALVAAPPSPSPTSAQLGTPTSGGPAAQTPTAGPARPGGFRLPFADNKAQLIPLQEQLARQSRTTLWLLLGAVGFVLLIACANIANLQLARAAGRKREAAIRAALGASPARLALELLAENLLLATLGGALGVLFAWAGSKGLALWLADYLPRVNPIGVNPAVLGFAALLAIAAGLAFGLAPAWQGSRIDLLETLKEGGHQASPAGARWRQGLVALEVALALVLAINAGLLMRSIYQLYATELGFRTSDVLTANLALPRRYSTPAQQRDFATRWLEALAKLPGVKAAALTDMPPLSPYQQMMLTVTQGSTGNTNASASAPPPTMAIASVTPEFFKAAGIALREGRAVTDADGADAPKVAVVNEEFVRVFYPKGVALGAQVNLPLGPGSHSGPPPTAAIVGIVADTRPRGFESKPQPLAYFPLAQQPKLRLTAVLQFEGDAAALARAVTTATHKIDADLALDQPSTIEQQINRQNAPRRVTLMLTGTFAFTAVVLAALGIFGVMSYTVNQRTQEIGVRMALGADAGMILRWMLRFGGIAVGAGLAAGLVLTFATNKLMTTLLTGITALDPLVIAAGVAGLAAIGLAACLLPARRATRINPVEALRSE
jgi:predicted permease